jgi:hypothetical protein
MAISPGTYNTTLQRRADFALDLQFKDGSSSPINLTGWSVIAQAWNQDRTVKYADFAITYTNRLTGSVSALLTYAQTALFPDEVFYDVMLVNPANLREYYLEGTLYVSEGYSA